VFRFPGGKRRIAKRIYPNFDWTGIDRYVEPMIGGGALLAWVLAHTEAPALIADIDPAIVAVWRAVFSEDHRHLCRGIEQARLTDASWRRWQRGILDGENDPVKAIAVFRGSPNGRGPMSGGPARDATERWNVNKLTRAIRHLHRLGADRVTVEHADCFDILTKLTSADLTYLDPPYVDAGPVLYRHSFAEEDHQRLAAMLTASAARWYLSYDDHPVIRALYDGFRIDEIRNGSKTELLIRSTPVMVDAARNGGLQPPSRSLATP
jgi:DNA adenine methylase